MRFKVRKYRNCGTCNGEDSTTGMKAGFNVLNMEVTAEDDRDFCQECQEQSEYEYEREMEYKQEQSREE